MNRMRYVPALLLIAVLTVPRIAGAQEGKVHVEINRVYATFSVTKAELQQARSLTDLNKNYRADWVKTYRSVEISAYQDGAVASKMGSDAVLTTAQQALMAGADTGTPIAVKIEYWPDNNLKNNDIKEMNFSFIVEP
ncbi:MAG: energy transducer TonB, partial [Phaeodactylibacter sp.]|nr:energy transducer TonB [Phaeodactylibacter sp.]